MEYGLTEQQLKNLQAWGAINQRIIKFQKGVDLAKFKDIFGDTEGERLFPHFRVDCQNLFDKFRTYLSTEQCNIVLATIVKDDRFDL